MKHPFQLSRRSLKYIAIIAMVIDHIAFLFVPDTSIMYQIMRFIGRITAPVMAFFVAQGYQYTKDIKKYILRLFVFSLIAWPAYSLVEAGKPFTNHFSVITSLLFGLLMICVYEEQNYGKVIKWIMIVSLCLASGTADFGLYGPALVLGFHVYRDRQNERLFWYYLVTFTIIVLCIAANGMADIYIVGLLFVPVAYEYMYHPHQELSTKFDKWFFYWFYPLHLYLLWAIKTYIA